MTFVKMFCKFTVACPAFNAIAMLEKQSENCSPECPMYNNSCWEHCAA